MNIDLLRNIVVRDVEEDEELMNTAELEPQVIEKIFQQWKDYAAEEGKSDIFDKDITAEEFIDYIVDDFDDFGFNFGSELVYLAYFISEGYEPNFESDFYGFPQRYIDDKQYQIIVKTEDCDCSCFYETAIDNI